MKLIIVAWLLALVLGLESDQRDYSNNFFIILSSSKFFFNYRHSSNSLMVYRHLKDMGITDDKILLMLPENHACNARNKYPGTVLVHLKSNETFYCDDVEVDYKSDDLTYEAILNLFRGRYEPDVSSFHLQLCSSFAD